MHKNTYFTGQPIFSQLINLIPRHKVDQQARLHNSDRYYKKFKTYDHLISMLYCILNDCSSIREVVTGLLACEKKLLHIDLFIYNKYRKPRFSAEFPAKYLSTDLSWEDLVLNTNEELKLGEIKRAIKNLYLLKQDRNLGKHVKKGYRVIFYGESGTGKTLTATLIGKEFNKDVFRVDISSIVSKYVGETSKNLEKLFNMAEDKDWILFFDEGDAMFGKRTDTNQSDNKSSHYANQDVAYLLQRIEDYNGVIIVASNLRDNLDKAFARRFQMAIHFDYPSTENCIKLFQNNNPEICPLDPTINFDKIITENTPVSAANIINSMIRAALICMGVGRSTINAEILSSCFKDEKRKQPFKIEDNDEVRNRIRRSD